ncbi:LIM/homeobox protein Awh-like [Lytechinus pictus]|uniref:LIM/homeobox protein Awh-like n=1 Tax=Lytechinus pictus TaxID=7653 RepID=UPI0030B9BCAF
MGLETHGSAAAAGTVQETMSQLDSKSIDTPCTPESKFEKCIGCSKPIVDRFLLKIGRGLSWHSSCLRCLECEESLSSHQSCYFKDQNVFCRRCYSREFGTKCARCLRSIDSSDWVRRAREHVYHLACFACDNCKRQLSTGEEFAMIENRVLCKSHYLELVEATCRSNGDGSGSEYGGEGSGSERPQQKTKRIRTTFTEDQLEVLQANFNVDSNPDGQDLERIAQITGLSKRVTQVWFQNSRARQKKHSTPHGMETAATGGKCTPGGMGSGGGTGGGGGDGVGLTGSDGYNGRSGGGLSLAVRKSSPLQPKFVDMLESCGKCGMIYCLCEKLAISSSS